MPLSPTDRPRGPVLLREAVAADARFLAELWEGVLRPGDAASREADVDRVLQRVAADPDERLVVADVDGRPAGAVLLRAATVSPLDQQPAVHAHSPHVHPAARRRGVGRALLGAAARFAAERGADRVLTASVAGSRESNRFLARLGLGQLATVRSAPASLLAARTGTAGLPVDPAARAARAAERREPPRRTARRVVAARRAVRGPRVG